MNEFRFSIPQDILVGRGTAEKLGDAAKKLGGTHAFIISGPHLTKMGHVQHCADLLAAPEAGGIVDHALERQRGDGADARRLGIQTGDTVEVWNGRGKCVVPAYVTERCLPGVVVLFEGAWMDLDEQGVDRAGNPDFLTLDEPSPAGAFAYNTALVNVQKTDLAHRPGWDQLATARSSVFRRDY